MQAVKVLSSEGIKTNVTLCFSATQALFAARAGYFYENKDKGNRRYFTMGIGLRYQKFGFDFAYLVPQIQNHPLAETLRFTLQFNFAEDEAPTVDE